MLTQDQITQYHTQGYLHLPAVYTPGEVDRCRALIEEDQASGGWAAAPYATDTVTADVYERIPELARIVFNDNYVAATRQLFAPEPILIAEPAIHKSRYYYWHKDSTFISAQGQDYHNTDEFRAAMTVFYLQENHPDYGGGISLIPRTQRTHDWFATVPNMNLAQRAWLKAQKTLRRSPFDRLDRHPDLRPIPTAVGDVLFLDMRLDHKGTPAKRPSPVTKYGIMNIACQGRATADRLRATLRNRPGPYYRRYLSHQPEVTPTLATIAQDQNIEILV